MSIERVLPWLRRASGPLLVVGALYLVAIASISPHPLPGLRALACSVLLVGLSNILFGTRFRRSEFGLSVDAIALGLVAIFEIIYASVHG